MKRWGSWIAVVMLMVMVLSGCSSGSQDTSSGASEAQNTETSIHNQASTTDGGAASGSSSDKSAAAKSDSKVEAEKPASANASLPNSSSQTTETAAGFNSQDLSSGLNKKLMYKGNIVMQIPDYGKAQTEIRNKVTLSGGYIVNFNETQSDSERGGTFVVKVPATGFSSFLNSLEKIAHEDLQRSIEGQDVTEEYVDLESRLKAKQIMEEQYIAFMKKATKTTDLVTFAGELERIQSEIEQIKGRMRYINQNVSYSTVEIRLYEEVKPKEPNKVKAEETPLGKRASGAFQGSIDVITLMVQWVIVILSGSLPVLVIAAIILLIVWLVRKSRGQSREEAARKRREMNAGSKVLPNGEERSNAPKDEP